MSQSKITEEIKEPPRIEGKHRFLGGTCVDCGHPLDEICTANLQLPGWRKKKPKTSSLRSAPEVKP